MKQTFFILVMMLSLTLQAQQINVTLTTVYKVKSDQPFKLTVALTDDKGRAIAGTVSVCVTDTVFKKNAQKNNSQGYLESLAKANDLMEVLHTMRPFTVTDNDQIIFAGSQTINDPLGALIVIDGQQMGDRASVINGIVPQTVVEIKMSKDPVEIQKYTSSAVSGVVVINTIKTKPKTVVPAKPIEVEQAPQQPLYLKDAIVVDSSGQIALEIPALKDASGLKITVNATRTDGQSGSATKIIKVVGGKR